MKERGILFSAPMVKALLSGVKTQTRRLVKPCPPSQEDVIKLSGSGFSIFTDCQTGPFRVAGPVWALRELMGKEPVWSCPYGSPGDRLWVRETWDAPPGSERRAEVAYRADYERDPVGARWRPAIHMFRWASRITLEVTEVRVQRLQAISHEDAQAEGVQAWIDSFKGRDEYHQNSQLSAYPATAFARLWDSINGEKAPWASNPWVFAITFRRVEV